MCGLSAVITLERRAHGDEDADDKPRDELRSRLSSSLDHIKHRGPDAQDIWISPDNSVALGHCRLSIVDLSPQGEQPLHDDEGHIHAVVMGEIYDDDVLRERCIQKFGYKFRGHSDSELVIALYKHYGAPAFLEHLRGEYAFVIYDDCSGEIIAARDRFGVKPLFWTRVGNTLLVAAEMKAFIPLGWIPEWNIDGIALSSCFVGSDTIFKDAYRLRPGYYLTASPDGRVGTHEYWDIHYRDKREIETRSVDEMVMSVREKIIESVRIRLRADVPVGIYLSGGIDSSAIAGITKYLVEEKGQKIGSQDIKKKLACFTIQFDRDSGFDESEIAERTANFLGVDMYVKDMNEAAMVRHFEDCIWHNEHHCWDLGTVGKFALSELPREHGFKVILSGEGADELFAGYQWFVPEFLLETDQSSPDLPLQRDDGLRRRLGEKAGQDILSVFSKVGTDRSDSGIEAELKLRLNKVGSPASMATRLTPREIFVPSLQTRYSSADVVRGVIDAWSPAAQEKVMNDWHPVHTSMYAWSKCQLPNYILTALGDRCEMAHSIEGRPPFLDHQLADLMGSIPPSLKMYYGPQGKGPDAGNNTWWHNADAQAAAQFWEKWILREAVKPFITEELYLRRKHFYSAPVLWPTDGPLHSLFKRLLTEENVKALGFVDWPEIRKSLERGFGEKADLSATRKCIIVGSFVTLSNRFSVSRARVKDDIIV